MMKEQYRVHRLCLLDVPRIFATEKILYDCGKNMAARYDLHHWDNAHVKWLLILGMCLLKNKVYVVSAADGQIVATYQTKQTSGKLLFEKLATSPLHAGKGIGSFCMGEIEEAAEKSGCDSVYCEVYDKSRHALRFYENRGYIILGEDVTRKYTVVQMCKKLG